MDRAPWVVVAPDSFKESLTAVEVAAAVRDGLLEVWPDADVRLVPLADGGEGTVDALVMSSGGTRFVERVRGPSGRTVEAAWGRLPDGTGVVEIAAGSGLHLAPAAERDPWGATSYGTGQLIGAAVDRGCRRLVVGLGGSATNDGGAGLLASLGARLLDRGGEPVDPTPAGLRHVVTADLEPARARLSGVHVEVACDVDNPLLGPEGATAVFGPQKGVRAEDVEALDACLGRWADVLAAAAGEDLRDLPGAGAAGGAALALVAALGARLRPGFEVVAEAVGLDAVVRDADLVITGEGRVDAQTLRGKAPAGVVATARRHGVPVLVLAGVLGEGAHELIEAGALAVVPILADLGEPEQALGAAAENLRRTSRAIAAIWQAGQAAGG